MTRNSPTFFTCRAPEHLPRRPSHPWCSTKPVVQRRSNVQNSEEEERGVAGERPHRRYSCVVRRLNQFSKSSRVYDELDRTGSPLALFSHPLAHSNLRATPPHPPVVHRSPPNETPRRPTTQPTRTPPHPPSSARRPRESHYLSVPRRSVLRIARLPRTAQEGSRVTRPVVRAFQCRRAGGCRRLAAPAPPGSLTPVRRAAPRRKWPCGHPPW